MADTQNTDGAKASSEETEAEEQNIEEASEQSIDAKDEDIPANTAEDDEQDDEDFIETFKKLGIDLEILIRSIKPAVIVRDIRLVAPRVFNRNFRGFRPEKVGRGKMVKVLSNEILERENIRVAQLVSLLWNHANQNIYKAMKELVRTINPDVEKVEHIDSDKATEFVDELERQGFKRQDIHICVRLNGVRFDQDFITERLMPSDDS